MCKMSIPYALMHPHSVRDAEFCTGNNKKLDSLSSSVERAEDPSFSKRIANVVLSYVRTVFQFASVHITVIKNKNKIMVCGICRSLHSAYIYILHAFQLLETNWRQRLTTSKQLTVACTKGEAEQMVMSTCSTLPAITDWKLSYKY